MPWICVPLYRSRFLGHGCCRIGPDLGIGPVLIAGPLLGWILGALEEAVAIGGVMAIGAALNNLRIPKDSVGNYDTALKSQKFVLMVHGTAEEVARAQSIIRTKRARSIDQGASAVA